VRTNSELRVLALWGLTLAAPAWVFAQTPASPAPLKDLSAAYYHAALGHLYSDLAAQYGGRSEYVNKAIDNFKQAMRYDPDSPFLAEELADLYLQTGQIRSAINEFEDAVKRNPDDLNARRILARFYTARLREGSQSRSNQEMLHKAIEQYEKVAEKAPRDTNNLIMLGRLYKMDNRSQDAENAFKKVMEVDPENEEAMTGLAIVYSDNGDNVKATEMLRKVAEKYPNMRTLMALGSTYEQMKEFKLAADAYKRALDLNPANTDLKRAYADELFKAEDYDTALKVFEELIAEDPNDPQSNLRLSMIYRIKRDFPKAHEYARKARELDTSNDLNIRYNEVDLLAVEGKTQEAIATLREMIDSMPKSPATMSEKNNRIVLLERLGGLCAQADQTEQAVQAYREIAQLDPDVASKAVAQIIETYRYARMFKEADKEAQAALAKYPDDRVVKATLANVQADMGQFDKAVANMKSLFDGKNDKQTWLGLASIHEKARNFAEMARDLDNAEKLATTDDERADIWFMRGAMYEKEKRYDASEAEFRKVLKLNPQSASTLNYLGYMLADRNVRLTEAHEMIQKAVDQEPQNGAYLDSLGWVYFRMNRLAEAEDWLQKALEHTPRDPAVHDHMADVYAALGKLKDAISQWEMSLQEYHTSPAGENDPDEIAKVQKKLDEAKVRMAKGNGGKK